MESIVVSHPDPSANISIYTHARTVILALATRLDICMAWVISVLGPAGETFLCDPGARATLC